jgi:hypothetical protein
VATSSAASADVTARRLQSVGGAVSAGVRGGSTRPLRVFLCSHDGYGLGHLRRNTLIAAATRAAYPTLETTLVTGVAVDPG